MPNILTKEIIIIRAMATHGSKYDYSKVKYVNMHSKIIIKCPIHGEFKQTPSNHIKGDSCPKCNGGVKLTTAEFIKNAKKIHGKKYDYKNVLYINSKTKISILCHIHGEFKQVPYAHVSGKAGCPKCYVESRRLSKEEFIKRAKIIHNNKYSYKLVEYKNSRKKVKIICNKHGEFKQYPESHLLGIGCNSCKNSRGENIIQVFLTENKIPFIKQKTFDECRLKRILKFDFYIPDKNMCIEYDGQQHFECIDYYGGEKKLKESKERDSTKNEYCKKNNINLLRISYKDNLLDILNKIFKTRDNNYTFLVKRISSKLQKNK